MDCKGNKGWYCFFRKPCKNLCGDGIRAMVSDPDIFEEVEECDDGNTYDGDGCSSDCVVEEGYICHETNELFTECQLDETCGNGIIEG